MSESANPPIVCDMTDAVDTAAERVAEYHQLFAEALIGRERIGERIRFRLRLDDGIEARVRSLSEREKACCAFFDFAISERDGELHWEAGVVDDPVARQILDEFFKLPGTGADVAEAHRRFSDQGLVVVTRRDGEARPATAAELGLPT